MNILYICTLIFALTVTGFTATSVNGRILNATHDSSGVASATVYLQKMTQQQQMPVQVGQTQSNSLGFFQFDVNEIDAAATYFTAIDFHGIRYFSDGFQLPADAAGELDVIVYDSTHSADAVDAFMHHIIVDDFGDVLQFRETRVLNNPGNKAITEAFTEEHMGPALFQFHLPAGTINFTPLSAHSSDELIQHGHYAIDRGIFLPGNKTISFGYELPMAGKSVPLAINVTHAAKTFDLFISSDNIQIVSPQLTDNGPFEIRGKKYHRYGVTNVAAGTDIEFTIRRTGKAAHEQSPTPALALTAALLAIGLAIGYTQREKTISSIKSHLPARKKELLTSIAQLDASGATDAQTKKQRHAKMIELQNIELQLSGKKSSRARK